MRDDGVDVVRLWMFSHEDWHGFEESEGVYDEQQFALFDYVIESARTIGLRLMPVFENYWEAYGGIDTRLRWEGLSGGQPARAAFFDKDRCPGCFTSYKNYVSHALNRTNHSTVDRWEPSFTFAGGQSITHIWNATHVQKGQDVTVTHPSGYNTSIAPGGTVNFGFSGASQAGPNGIPASFTLNGAACSSL